MANARKLAQLSSMFAGMGQSAATYNPAQKSMLDNLQGSAQSAIAAEAQKEAEKKAKKKQSSGLGAALGGAAALAAAPFTGGASLTFLPAAMSAGGALESATKGDMQGAISNTANAVGSGYGAYKSYTTPQSVMPGALPAAASTGVGAMQEAGGAVMGRGEKPGGMATAPTNRPDMSKLKGGVPQMMNQQRIASMKPQQLRHAILSGDVTTEEIANHIQMYGMSPRMYRGLPVSVRNDLRDQGYQMPSMIGGF